MAERIRPSIFAMCACCRGKFASLAIELLEHDIFAYEVLRTPERQQELYALGRSKTMRSKHITGHAVDFVPKDHEGNWWWPRSTHPKWKILRDAAKRNGLINNLDWDRAHVEARQCQTRPKGEESNLL